MNHIVFIRNHETAATISNSFFGGPHELTRLQTPEEVIYLDTGHQLMSHSRGINIQYEELEHA